MCFTYANLFSLFLLHLIMTTIAEMYNRVKRLDLRKQVPILIEQSADELIALNQRQLYNKSEDSEGIPLRFYANNGYAFYKEQLNSNPGFGRPDYRLTGAFYRGFYLSVTNSSYSIDSRDSKTAKLEARSPKVFGLTNDSKSQYVQNTLFIGVKKYIEGITGLQMV